MGIPSSRLDMEVISEQSFESRFAYDEDVHGGAKCVLSFQWLHGCSVLQIPAAAIRIR